ncbi:MAG: glycosyltransferase family 2 protein [Acidimicrobiia bacterium]
MSGHRGAVLSVGIPTYNRSKLLRRALTGVVNQTLENIEIWVLDNASTDDTADVVASFHDDRIHYVRNETNIGHRANATAALRAGSAPYVALLFDDDEMYPSNLERKVEMLDRYPGAVVAHGAYDLVRLDGATEPKVLPEAADVCLYYESGHSFIQRSFREPCRIWISSAVARRDAIEGLGFFERFAPADDHRIWLDLATRGDVVYDSTPRSTLSVTPGMSTGNEYLNVHDGRYVPNLNTVRAALRVMRSFTAEHKMRPDDRARLWWLSHRYAHGNIPVIIRRNNPGLRPLRASIAQVRSAVRIDPTILLNPKIYAKLALEAVGMHELR